MMEVDKNSLLNQLEEKANIILEKNRRKFPVKFLKLISFLNYLKRKKKKLDNFLIKLRKILLTILIF